jgi:tetratricopeptide (TPR) repeat protein
VGQFPEAVTLLEKELDLAKTHLIPRHPIARSVREDLARAYRLVKRFDEAQALYEENLRAWKEDAGPDSDAVHTVLWSLALVHLDRGDYARAEPLLREALAGKRRTAGADAPVVARLLSWLGVIALKQQKYAEAEVALRECLAIRDAKLPDDWSRFNAQSLLGAALLGQGKYAEAEPLLLSGYAGLKQRAATISAEFKDRVPEALERLVQLCEATGKPEEAAKWKKELEAAKAVAKPPA